MISCRLYLRQSFISENCGLISVKSTFISVYHSFISFGLNPHHQFINSPIKVFNKE